MELGYDIREVTDEVFRSENSVVFEFAMVAYSLKNTVTENGSVSRGICTVEKNRLKDIVERKTIEKKGDKIALVYTITVISGMKGIAKLASICSYLFFALLFYVLFLGGETEVKNEMKFWKPAIILSLAGGKWREGRGNS